MNKIRGFTLIEILIALAIFAILATITSSILYYTFNIRSHLLQRSNEIDALQLTIAFLQQDINHIVLRAVRSNNMQLIPAFIGQSRYLEFTRDGISNPGAVDKRSNLQRVALIC